ncbi:MAG: glycoside hydrolase family 2 TIM barrel-domain containing protein, partial [Armatimonadota bacterium]|nr:glycoside hydrolase family 2 TIM barrel-domain containing protein [Armatimonadota bacterium]
GIWQDVKLLVNDDIRLTDFWARSVLSKDLKHGEARAQVEIESASAGEATVEVEVSFAGKKAGSAKQEVKLSPGQTTAKLKISVPNVKLWWPNGSGEQNLYEAEVRLLDAAGEVIDERKTRFGFKQVRLTPNTNVSPEALPWSFEVNGRPTFVKGWNWVPIDHMYGGGLDAKYERLLKLARDANANLIRIWGGGLIEKEIFYRLCDECGIMVWQEFTLSSSAMESVPPTNPAYLKMLREAATKIVPLRRNHASLTVWCGGNELVWAGEEDPAMKIMHSICAKLDPDRLYIPTSPMLIAGERQSPDRDIHGNWLYNGVEAHYKAYNDLRATFHSEFGCEGAANLENIPRFIKDVALWPPSVKNEIWAHRGEWWANYEKLCGIFGEITDLPAFVRLSQFIQWEGLRYIIEANRRRKHSCGGAIPWQYNEPWPNLSCTNAVDWYATPKMAYYAVARAYDPVRVSAKYEKLAWKESETFRADIWVNNSLDAIPGASVETRITDVYGTLLCEMDATLDVQENRATHAFALDWRLPAGFEGIFMLTALLRDGNGIVRSENVYIFGASSGAPLSPMMSLPPTKIKVKKIEDGKGKSVVSIANKGTAYAMFVRLRPKDLDADIYFNDNYLVIPPGEERTVSVRLDGGGGKLICAGWNTNCLEVGG